MSREVAPKDCLPSSVFHSEDDALISPKAAAKLLDCSRTSVDRIANRAGWTRVFLGHGRNGLSRYRLNEVKRFIEERSVRPESA